MTERTMRQRDATHYSIKGLREDFRFALGFASVLSLIAAIPLALVTLVNIAAHGAHDTSAIPWPALGEFAVVVGGCYFATALLGTPVLFLARPIREGRLGWVLGAFVVFTFGIASMSLLLLWFPDAAIVFSRHGEAPPTPGIFRSMIRISPFIGLFGSLIAAFSYSEDRHAKLAGATRARTRLAESTKRPELTAGQRTRAKLDILRGAIFTFLGGMYTVLVLRDRIGGLTTSVVPGRASLSIALLMCGFGLWQVWTSWSKLRRD
jgi:hypothetical protein